MEISIVPIGTGKEFLAIDSRQLLHHINALVTEHSLIITDRKYSIAGEAKWKKESADEIDHGRKLIIAAFVGGKLAGLCEARRGRGKERFNLFFGMSVAEKYRHHGIGDEMLSLAIDEGKRRFDSKNIYITYHGDNKVARKMYESFGFEEIARLPKYMFHYGEFVDRVIMQLKR
jgi:RimJ/RimL family protein N-acetyltransferase